jgi:hypothetical protein
MRHSLTTSAPRPRWYVLWLLALAALPFLLPVTTTRVSAQTPPATIQVTCSPDTFRPDVWVVVECVTVITNTSQTDIPRGQLNILSVNGPVPLYFFISLLVDGDDVPIGSGQLGFGVPPLAPGASSTSHLIVLLKMTQGTWSGRDSVMAGDEEVGTLDLRLTADPHATAPSQDLLVTKKLVQGPPSNETQPQIDVYETKVTNQSPSTITDLTLTERPDYYRSAQSDPSPATQDAAFGLVTWDLASFGKDSLAPGESLVLRRTYPLSEESGCLPSSSSAVVEATVAGNFERVGARADEEFSGQCLITGNSGVILPQTGPGDMPIGFGRGGEGPTDSSLDLLWAATLLTAAGSALVVLAAFARRRARQ